MYSIKKLFLFLIFAATLVSAQNHRFIYDYHFVKDTLNISEVSKEMMYLDISKEGSKFYSRDAFVADSVMIAGFEKQIRTTGSMNVTANVAYGNKAAVRYKIYKSYSNLDINMEIRLGRDVFKVSDDRDISWSILPEKEKIGEFMTQKATAFFGGRKWTAWFSTELPFQDGPYKFNGLPGLIIKMEDATKTHQFELKGVGKFKEVEAQYSELNPKDKTVSIAQNQYKKLLLENRNDPAKDLKQMISSGKIARMKDANGSEISTTDFIKKMERDSKEKTSKDNNLIEIDLLKP